MSNSVIDSEGNKRWLKNGKLHRIDGPAFEGSSGTEAWYEYGELHRIDCPAIEWEDGSKSWYKNGKLHRIDDHAIEHADGTKEWYLNDVELSEELFLQLTGDIKDLPLYMGKGFDSFISERLISNV